MIDVRVRDFQTQDSQLAAGACLGEISFPEFREWKITNVDISTKRVKIKIKTKIGGNIVVVTVRGGI
jgi:hypothetical protein